MLPKPERLTKEDFQGSRPRVFFRGELFEVAYTSHLSQKFACVIAKKRVKTAVARNSIKRKLFSLLETIKPEKQGFFIFYIKAIPKETTSSQLKEEILKAFATLH